MVMMTSVFQLVSPDCRSASLINFGLSVQTASLRRKHSHRQVGLARRCTDEEHADICGVARARHLVCRKALVTTQKAQVTTQKAQVTTQKAQVTTQ